CLPETVSGPGYGPRLECSYNKSGIPPVPPRKLALTFPWLPPILYKLHKQSISSYSKAPRGLSVLSRVMRIFTQDRKSTRLTSSHVSISYAVFCLKKKNNKNNTI